MVVLDLKRIISLLLILCLCGCSVTYEIEIKEDKVLEKGELLENKNNDKVLNNNMTLAEEIDHTIYTMKNPDVEYDKKIANFELDKIDNNNKLGISYKNELDLNTFIKSPIIYQCYDSVNITNNKNSIFINTNGNFKCFDYYKRLNDVKIVLKTDYSVVSSNYDEKDNNVYYWYINKDNYKNKSINLYLSKQKNYLSEEQSDANWEKLEGIFVIVGLLSLVFCMFVFIKARNANK